MTSAQESFAELHDELTSVARDLLSSSDPNEAIDWRLISQSGWPGLEIAEQLDGAGATFAEVAVILREIGRAAARGPYPAVAGLAVGALNLLEPGRVRDGLLGSTAIGDCVPILVLSGNPLAESRFQITGTPEGLRLSGGAEFVLDASRADRLLVPATDPDGMPLIVDLDPSAPGLVVTDQPVLDETRSFGCLTADSVLLATDSTLRFRRDPHWSLQRLHDRAAVAVACDSLGLSEAMLDATVAYAGVREQFGRKIGSFQAVKHACADMLVQVTVAGKLVADAVERLSDDHAETSSAASMAKSFSTAMAVEVAGKAMQLHGGMGYTWESGIHVYLKRATLNRALFGSPAAHRKQLAKRYPAHLG